MRLLAASTLAAGALLVAMSARADEKSQCLSAASQGQTARDAHRLVEARDAFRVCARQTCPNVVQTDCAEWLVATERTLPTIVFDAKDASGGDISGVKVTVDGRPFADRLDGSALSVDPGDHDFTFNAPGRQTVTRHFILKEGEKQRRERIVLVETTTPPGPDAHGAPTPTQAPPPAEIRAPDKRPSGGLGTRRVLALVVGGAGVVAAGIGGFLNLTGKSSWEAVKNRCPNNLCTPADASTAQSAATEGTVGMIVFGAGVLAAAAGAVLWFTGSPEAGASAARPAVGAALAPNGVLLKGVW